MMTHRGREEGQCSLTRSLMYRVFLFASLWITFVISMPVLAAVEETDLVPEAVETIKPQDGWQFGANVYMWLPDLGGETTGGGTLDVAAEDLLKSLDMAVMGGVSARKGNWSLTMDTIYMALEADNNKSIPTKIGPSPTVDATLKLQAWVVTPLVGYTVYNDGKFSAEVVAGARYLYMKPELDLEISGPVLDRDRKISSSGDVWDGVTGLRGKVTLSEKWYVPYYVDAGTGQSTLTWQGMTGVGYSISTAVDVVVAYRYLYYKFDDAKVIDTLDLAGH